MITPLETTINDLENLQSVINILATVAGRIEPIRPDVARSIRSVLRTGSSEQIEYLFGYLLTA